MTGATGPRRQAPPSTRLHRRGRALVALLAGAVALAAWWLGWSGWWPAVQLDHLAVDSLLRLNLAIRATDPPRARGVVVVDIDDPSLAAVGQWPWPRYRIAQLVDRVADAGPGAIGLDILFSEPDHSSLKTIRQAFRRDFGIDLQFSGASPGLADNDAYLGEVLGRAPVVTARHFHFDHVAPGAPAAPATLQVSDPQGLLSPPHATAVLDNIDEISRQVNASGFINAQADADGMMRRMPLVIEHAGRLHPHLAIATLMRAAGVPTATVQAGLLGPQLRVGEHLIPVDEQGRMTLDFRGGQHRYARVAALEVLNGQVERRRLAGQLVFVGSSATGLNDMHSTIVDSQFPGLTTLAVVADNVLADRHVRELPGSSALMLALCVLVAGATAGLFVHTRSAPLQVLGAATLAAALPGLALLLLAGSGVLVSPAMPLLVLMSLFTLCSVTAYARERRQSQRWYRRLANARQVTMESMAAVAETRDPETGAHIKRTQHYVRAIAERLRAQGHYLDILQPDYIELLFESAPLHDIGKVGVPDNILLKPARLSSEEFVLMKKHADYGRNIIASTARRIEGDNFLQIAGDIAATHHEKWDGSGYPNGLAGQDIPLAGRIMAVADVYDALISRRCYKPPFSHVDSMAMMRSYRGGTFDPLVFDAFASIEPEIVRIAALYHDDQELVVGDR
ncbi:MAG: hypothetical protein RLZZ584_1537 [Pseudomonadota bacterium]